MRGSQEIKPSALFSGSSPWSEGAFESRSDRGAAGIRETVFAQTTATFTQLIGGRESNRQSHWSPLSRPIQSWPVVVPK